ncbi:glucose-1-phosphate adenylyltransferase [Bowmanella dokdonensis]|uniref:Glucose-1-phosphate adenylyltransferase n=1 Tax=Bowmanella dokdonensis TaxID=751969 RepID=A0A939DNV6_9ALTE|nr:glucose-1-phosphate adenylyltransferase [Bowmanella dokdonensis]MBN7826087.1 glucose-1-phosphate adenylyltransferase [Bowmanella dokdonensis]
MARTLAMILAGGAGTRLHPLTQTRTKPAVPFAGALRLVDFVLNNFVNSDLLKIYLLTQFKSQSLNIHLRQAWYLSGLTGNFIDAIPAQMRMGKRWYEGTADAIYQNIRLIESHDPDHVCIFGSDHIYKMDVRQVLRFHEKQQAALTVCATRVPVSQAHRFGVIEVDEKFRMVGFEEKPDKPKALPDDPHTALVSMGNYVFDAKVLYKSLYADAEDKLSTHDFGHDIIPGLYRDKPVYVYDFTQNTIDGEINQHYWRDVGTLHSFWQAHMDLLACEPAFELNNPRWPLRSYHPPVPPARILADRQGNHSSILNSIISSGCRVVGSRVERSVLGFNVQLGAGSRLQECVMLGRAEIGEGCCLKRVITDKGVVIAPGTELGFNPQQDRARGLTVTDEGLVVVAKGMKVGC